MSAVIDDERPPTEPVPLPRPPEDGGGAEVRDESRRRLLAPRLVFLFLLGWLLFGYPILGLFSSSARIAGVPLLFVYIFVVWAALIAAIAAFVEPGWWRRRP